MYFNSITTGSLPEFKADFRQPKTILFPSSKVDNGNLITVLTSLDHPVNKRFYLDENGQVAKQSYRHAYFYDATPVAAGNIDDLARLIESCSASKQHILIRGLPVSGQCRKIQRLGENFAEHQDGSFWAMLDFDNIAVPESMDPLSTEAIEWVIAKLPTEFQSVTYFYQHSASAGILSSDGTLMKSGLNVHIFFWLNRRILGKPLSAYLEQHCIETGFFTLGENRGGNVRLACGVDPAPLRSQVQPHFVSAPTIETGVTCRVTADTRQGLVRKSQGNVALPVIEPDIERTALVLRRRLLNDYNRTHGYETKVMLTNVQGKVGVTRYSRRPDQQGQAARRGRSFSDAKLSSDGKYLTLYFEDEGSPGSWYVRRSCPQIGTRHGDGESLPLKELSERAHNYVRDELSWFSEVPHHHLPLVNGYVPPLGTFAMAKISLVLAPTGAGKTSSAITWIRERIEQRQLVLYAAPTIALVKQMRDDLTAAGLAPAYYKEAWGPNFPRCGVVVTTNESLSRLLKQAYAEGIAHVLILDEIHQGLDRFMSKNFHLKDLEAALGKARQSLLLTGTLTDVQRHAIVEISKHALSSLNESDYCCYEFAPFKRNPLLVSPSNRFDNDLAVLLGDFQEKLSKGQPIPRLVMLLDTSKMEMYRNLLAKFGLSEHAVVVSRPENSEDEIEAARTSTRPILISSPLFGLGLNFVQQPVILVARFDHVSADTSQIIQAVNRANRGDVQCEVRIYGNVFDDAEFLLPNEVRLRKEIDERIRTETSLPGYLEEHFQLDRVTYQMLRKAEHNSQVALSMLVRNNAIQNFSVVIDPSLPEIDDKKAAVVREARKDAKADYNEAVRKEGESFAGLDPSHALIKLYNLDKERKNGWRTGESRLERELDNEEAGIFMGAFDIADPVAAQRVDLLKVKRLFGEASPWISGQYNRDSFPDWAMAEAEKTAKYMVLFAKLKALRAGEVSAEDLSGALTRNVQFGESFLALASSDVEFQSIKRKLQTLKKERETVRTRSGNKARQTVKEQGLNLLREFLEPLGVTYDKKKVNGRFVVDNTKPIVPPRWDFSEMNITLQRQAARLRALPTSQKLPIVTEEFGFFSEPVMPRKICECCVFFHQSSCVVGRPTDWQSSGGVDPDLKCEGFKRIKVELM